MKVKFLPSKIFSHTVSNLHYPVCVNACTARGKAIGLSVVYCIKIGKFQYLSESRSSVNKWYKMVQDSKKKNLLSRS